MQMPLKYILSLSLIIVAISSCGGKKNSTSEVADKKSNLEQKESPKEEANTTPATPSTARGTDDSIKKIKALYADTEKKLADKALTVKKIGFEFGGGFGEINYYFEDGKLLKATLGEYDYNGGGVDRHYYLDNGKTYFAFHSTLSGDPGPAVPNTQDTQPYVVNITEKRIYFSDGRAIKCLYKNFEYQSTEKNPSDKIKSEEKDCTTELLQEIDLNLKTLDSLKNTEETTIDWIP